VLDGLSGGDGGIEHGLVIDLAGDLVGVPLGCFAELLEHFLKPLNLLVGLLEMAFQPGDEVAIGCLSDALNDGGFESAIAGSGEEAVTLLRGNRHHYRALVTDVNLLGTMDGCLARWTAGRSPSRPERSIRPFP
jgi:CheY-like chemotaxis protein